MKLVWKESVNGPILEQKVAAINEMFELSKLDFLKLIESSLIENLDLKIIEETREVVKMELQKKLSIVKFKYQFELQIVEDGNEIIYEEFIRPLYNVAIEENIRLKQAKEDLDSLNRENDLLISQLASCGYPHKKFSEFAVNLDRLNQGSHEIGLISELKLWEKEEIKPPIVIEPSIEEIKKSKEDKEIEKRRELEEKLAKEPEKKKKKRIL